MVIYGNESVDILCYDGTYTQFEASRIETKHMHGTGCTFSVAIAPEWAKGRALPEAVAIAKVFVNNSIKYVFATGEGHRPVNPTSCVLIPVERQHVIESIREGVQRLLGAETEKR